MLELAPTEFGYSWGQLNGEIKKDKQWEVNQNLVNPEKPDVPLNKNDAFQKVQKRRVQEKR